MTSCAEEKAFEHQDSRLWCRRVHLEMKEHHIYQNEWAQITVVVSFPLWYLKSSFCSSLSCTSYADGCTSGWYSRSWLTHILFLQGEILKPLCVSISLNLSLSQCIDMYSIYSSIMSNPSLSLRQRPAETDQSVTYRQQEPWLFADCGSTIHSKRSNWSTCLLSSFKFPRSNFNPVPPWTLEVKQMLFQIVCPNFVQLCKNPKKTIITIILLFNNNNHNNTTVIINFNQLAFSSQLFVKTCRIIPSGGPMFQTIWPPCMLARLEILVEKIVIFSTVSPDRNWFHVLLLGIRDVVDMFQTFQEIRDVALGHETHRLVKHAW